MSAVKQSNPSTLAETLIYAARTSSTHFSDPVGEPTKGAGDQEACPKQWYVNTGEWLARLATTTPAVQSSEAQLS